MRIQMRVSITGTRNGADWPAAGGEIDLPDAEAADLLAAGLAVEVATAPKPQAAAAPKPRKAAAKRAEKRG